jgi:hypothetical protein
MCLYTWGFDATEVHHCGRPQHAEGAHACRHCGVSDLEFDPCAREKV